MKNRLRQWMDRSEFARHVLTLMTGTGLGQLIAVLLAPVITRFYTPEEFSTLEQFAMGLAILGVFSTGKFEFAIMLPKKDDRARHLAVLSLRIAFFFSLVVFVVLLLTRQHIGMWMGNESLSDWILLLPVAIFGFAVFNTMTHWFGRAKKYKVAATSRIVNSAVSEPSKVALGAVSYTAGGLVIGVVVGRIATAIYMIRRFMQDPNGGWSNISKTEMRNVALEYKDYPIFNTWSSVLGRLAQWAHIFLFSHFFGLWTIGFFALTRRVVQNPLNMISSSYGQVFYQRIGQIHDRAELKRFYFKNLSRFLLFAVFIVGFALLLPQKTMYWVFGEGWEDTIVFLKILVFWYALNFISSSLSFINHKLQKQKAMLFLDALHLVLIAGSIWWSFHLGNDAISTLYGFVGAKVIFFAINIAASSYFVLNTPIPTSK